MAIKQRRYRANLKRRGCALTERLIDAGRLDPEDVHDAAAIGRATSLLLADWQAYVGRNEVDPVSRGTDDSNDDNEEADGNVGES